MEIRKERKIKREIPPCVVWSAYLGETGECLHSQEALQVVLNEAEQMAGH